MTVGQALILFFAAVLGATLNSVAGGGTFITFPTLIFTGVPSINANATSAVALWPGSVASARAYATSLKIERRLLIFLIVVSTIGGLLGALVLVHTPQATFRHLIPYLLLIATVLFAFGPQITAWVRSRTSTLGAPGWAGTAAIALLQLIISAYGGFFGGGMSILILSGLALLGLDGIHTMNAVKNLLAVFINGVAVIVFVILGVVYWQQALVMVVGAIIGGYTAGIYAQRLNPKLVRWVVIGVGVVLTVYFFVHG